MAGYGLKMDDKGHFAVDTAQLAGKGLVAEECNLNIDVGFLAEAIQSQINNDSQADLTQTVTLPYVVSTEYRYKPNGYGYNSGMEIIQKNSTLIIYKNAGGRTISVEQGPVNEEKKEFDFGNSVPVDVSSRSETNNTPNFYSKE
jgi:hypothetical protein